MSLDALAKDIGEAAKAEAKAIASDASAEADRIAAEAQSAVDEYRAKAVAKAEREADQVRTETVASARQANQKEVLIARREELDATWETLKSEVAKPGMAGRKDLLNALVKEASAAAKAAGGAKMLLRPASIDRAVLEKAGSAFTIGEDIDAIGGFMLESADGAVSLDHTFDSRLDAAWQASLGDVDGILFGG